MGTTLHVRTSVLPGNRVEVTAPQLKEGQAVDVFVIARDDAKGPTPSALDVIKDLKGHRLFQTPEEVDRYLQEERNSWGR